MGFPREVPWLLRPRALQPQLKKPPRPLQRRRKRRRRRTSLVPSLGPTTTWDSVSSIKNASLPRRRETLGYEKFPPFGRNWAGENERAPNERENCRRSIFLTEQLCFSRRTLKISSAFFKVHCVSFFSLLVYQGRCSHVEFAFTEKLPAVSL